MAIDERAQVAGGDDAERAAAEAWRRAAEPAWRRAMAVGAPALVAALQELGWVLVAQAGKSARRGAFRALALPPPTGVDPAVLVDMEITLAHPLDAAGV